MAKTKRYLKYSLIHCHKDVELHKANGLAAALQADKTKKLFGQKVNNKTDLHHYQHWWEGQMVVQRLLKCGVTGKFAWNNSSLYRKQTCWKDLKSEAARTKIKDYNQSKLTINQLTGLKTDIPGH